MSNLFIRPCFIIRIMQRHINVAVIQHITNQKKNLFIRGDFSSDGFEDIVRTDGLMSCIPVITNEFRQFFRLDVVCQTRPVIFQLLNMATMRIVFINQCKKIVFQQVR